AEDRPRLGSGRDPHLNLPVERRHRHHGPERGFSDGNRHLANHHIPFMPKKRVRTNAHDYVEITGRTTSSTRLSLSGDTPGRALFGARRNGYIEGSLLFQRAGPFACRARLSNHSTVSPAGRALLAEAEKTLLDLELPAAAAAFADL